MPTVTEIHRETALLVELEPRSVFVFAPLREVALLDDTPTVTPFAIPREVALLNDSTTDKILPLLKETAQLNDTVTGSVLRTRIQREVARLLSREVHGVRVTHVERETGELNDATDYVVDAVLRDAATLDDTVTLAAFVRRVLSENAKLSGRAVAPVAFAVRDTAELNDQTSPSRKTRLTVRDTAVLNDSSYVLAATVAVLRDTAELSDDTAIFQTHVALVRSVGYLLDNPVLTSYGRAYTCSIAGWGMSTFSNYAFKTMAGNFAAGANLWRLDAADDYGTPITSHITTGVMDMGASMTKRLSAIYVAGYSDTTLDVSVTADVNGEKDTYEYTLEARDQTNYRNNRALIGKGFRGRFVQVKIGGTNASYKLLAAEADVATSTRRV